MNDNDIENWHYQRTHSGDYVDEDTISEDLIDYVETYLDERRG